jgi:hypothetical protein
MIEMVKKRLPATAGGLYPSTNESDETANILPKKASYYFPIITVINNFPS